MAVRTTSGAIEAIIEVDATISLTPFIEVASALVDELCAGVGYSDARLELIERWLSAHFYAVRDPRTTNESAGGVSAGFESRVDLGLSITRYGQQAMMLDTKGALAALNKRTKDGMGGAGVFWLGKGKTERNQEQRIE